MATLTFSHGIVSHSTDTGLPGGTANFLVINSDKVDLSAPFNQSFVTVFAHRDTNYLLTLQQTSDIEAWGYGSISDENDAFDNVNGGGSGNSEYYLWIEIDRITGGISYGHSNYQPSAGSSPPFSDTNRPDGLHWFDTNQQTMKVWRKFGVTGKWVEIVRLFVAKYIYSASFSSVSINSPSYIGTTVGIVGQNRAGALIYDVGGKPVLRTDANNNTTFFTTEDVFTSGLPVAASPVSGNRARYETFLVDAIGVAPAPAYSIVRFTDFNEVVLMNAALQSTSLWGMIEFEIGASGDLVQVTMNGQVRNPLWNWSTVAQRIFVDKNNDGQLVTVEDDNYVPLPNQLPIGVVIDSKAILLCSPEILR